MAEQGGYKISDLYQGGYSSFKNDYGSLSTGYSTSTGTIGLATDPRTANILKEFGDKIAPGQKTMELSLITPEIIETIPKQHLKEVNRLAKLAGVDVTVHGPLVEASGLSKEGYSEMNRALAERQMMSAVEKAHELSPKGNSPVTFHSSAVLPATEVKKVGDGEEIQKMLVIDQESGQITAASREEKFYPHQKDLSKPTILPAEDQVNSINATQWEDSLTQLIAPKQSVDNVLDQNLPLVQNVYDELKSELIVKGPKATQEILQHLKPTQAEVFSRTQNAKSQLDDMQLHLSSLFNKAFKYGNDEEKKYLTKLSEQYKKQLTQMTPFDLKPQSQALQGLMEGLRIVKPEVFTPLDKFSFGHTTDTFANVAFQTYNKFGEEAPIISIENPPAWMSGLSRGEDLKNIVVDSREKFVKQAMDKKGMDKKQAEQAAEKMIGVTWDVGHINQIRRFGFDKEDVVKETEKIAPYLKHVHLSDNFGIENVELPMGMGDVPFKEMMQKLGKKGDSVKKIVEAGNWFQHFQKIPMAETFEALGSPIYSMGMGPYWNQTLGLQQGYFSGYGNMLPQVNYETFGAGFSRLPAELGGQSQGGGGRMGGAPLE
jgi:sugar phosphate isomerase/epimerase